MSMQIREVRVIDLITYSVLSPLFFVGMWLGGIFLLPDLALTPMALKGVYVAMAIISYFLLKRSVIGAVLIYKAFAPMSVRDRCRFTPTCSTYMIMAINKYGLFRGVFKGIGRLLRCKPPNGGEDYP